MTKKDTQYAITVFRRLCKEEGLFGTTWHKVREASIRDLKNAIYYDIVGCTLGIDFYKQYKIQIHLLKWLLDYGALSKTTQMYCIKDILNRYDTSDKRQFEDDEVTYDLWKNVEKLSDKHEIRKYFIEKYEEKYGIKLKRS